MPLCDHALMATLPSVAVPRHSNQGAMPSSSAACPYRIFQLGLVVVVYQVMVICAGSGP